MGSIVVALEMPANKVGGYTNRFTAMGTSPDPKLPLPGKRQCIRPARIVNVARCAGQVIIAIALRLLLMKRNKQREAVPAMLGNGLYVHENVALQDVTDFKPHFKILVLDSGESQARETRQITNSIESRLACEMRTQLPVRSIR